MRKILIINLRRLGDVYSSAHLISSMSEANPAEIHMLVYQESVKAAKSLKNVTAIHTINRLDIITLKSNKLFSDVDAFSELYKKMIPVKEIEWDEVINFSNDPVGTYLTSYLQNSAAKISGIYYDNTHRTVLNNKWSILFNDIMTTVTHSPMHFVDCYHRMAATPLKLNGSKINTQSTHGLITQKRISLLREEQTLEGKIVKIVGIQIQTSSASKDIPVELLTDFIFLIKKSPGIIPILLIAPNDQERARAQIISENFKEPIATIESDLASLPSILSSLDLLVTPDTAIKHIADLTNTPVLEVSLGTSPFFKQGTYSTNSYVLTDAIDARKYLNIQQTSITAMDMVSCVFYFLNNIKNVKPTLSSNVTLYGARFDQLGIHYYPIAGHVDQTTEIARLMNRQLVSIIFQNTSVEDIYIDAQSYGQAIINKWADTEKNQITTFMRDLLSTMRTLLQNRSGKNKSMEFVQSLGRLLHHGNNNQLTQIPCLLFKGKLELIRGTTIEENTKEVEVLLHELKSNVLKALLVINQLESNANNKKQTFNLSSHQPIIEPIL